MSQPFDEITHDQIHFALGEEIGDPELFVGRRQEMARLMKWVEGTKRRLSGSMGILARRKKGKTALLQRFFNLLYTRNDPQLIPFYYRVQETRLTRQAFAVQFYCALLSQYFAFTQRRPELVARPLSLNSLDELASGDAQAAADLREMREILEHNPEQAWPFAQAAGHRLSQLNDVRILQVLDEFQYLNKWIVSDLDGKVELLCHSYMGAAESKFSPQIVAGSYIGWLGAILSHMTARYDEWHLEGLSEEEALEEVYNYAYLHRVAITDDTAPYIAEVCQNDPFYIAALLRNRSEEKDLTTRAGVREALTFETIAGQGAIARVWNEYLLEAVARVNDRNAHRIVLYLASHEPEERTRAQIQEDLGLEMGETELDKRLKQLVAADILTQGSSNFRFRGLGDPIFARVFRRLYGEEIEQISVAGLDEDFKRQLSQAKGLTAWHKGRAAEFKVRYQLLIASQREATFQDLCGEALGKDAASLAGTPVGPFRSIRKARFYLDQERSFEEDLHAMVDPASSPNSPDLIVEVKARKGGAQRDEVGRFIEMKEALGDRLERPTHFLFYSEDGLAEELVHLLLDAGIGVVTPERLASFEAA